MKIYLYSTVENDKVKKILSYLRRAEMDIASNTMTVVKEEVLSDIDLLFIFGDKFDSRSGYLVALALAQKKRSFLFST